MVNSTTYLHTYKVGDYVTIMANSSFQTGLPWRAFHGKTGKVWNVNPRAIGVMINKRVRNKILVKRLHLRIQHIKPSNCNKDFLERKEATKKVIEENKQIKKQNETLAKEGKELLPLKAIPKRLPRQPKEAGIVEGEFKFTTVSPMKYEELY